MITVTKIELFAKLKDYRDHINTERFVAATLLAARAEAVKSTLDVTPEEEAEARRITREILK